MGTIHEQCLSEIVIIGRELHLNSAHGPVLFSNNFKFGDTAISIIPLQGEGNQWLSLDQKNVF